MLAQYMQVLKDEVQSDPLSRGYSSMSDQTVADDLNTKYREKHRRVPVSEIQNWASAYRIYKRFCDNSMEKGPLHNELLAIIQGKQEDVNFQSDSPGVSQLIQDMIDNEIITQTEAQELQGLGTYHISRAEELGYKTVSANQIATIRSF